MSKKKKMESILKEILDQGINELEKGTKIKPKAKKEPEQQVIEGEGIVDFVKNTFDAIKNGVRKGPSPKLRAMIEKYGEQEINKISIMRAPINKAIKFVSNLITRGRLKKQIKEMEYDDIYHLSFVFALDSGQLLRYEKNEVPVLTSDFKITGSQMNVTMKQPIKLKDFLDVTVKSIGVDNYYLYSVEEKNCQNFLLSHLIANGLNSSAYQSFIMQDAYTLLQKDPAVIGIFRKITDLGALFNVAKEGRGLGEVIGKIIMDIIKAFNNNKPYEPQPPPSSRRRKPVVEI